MGIPKLRAPGKSREMPSLSSSLCECRGRLAPDGRSTEVELEPHPLFEHLLSVLESRADWGTPWTGVVFRSVRPRYAARRDVLSGEGSRLLGGRWNAPGSFAVVYASLDPETALAESMAHHRHYGIPDHQALPRLLLAIEARLRCVLDARRSIVRKRLLVSEKRMIDADWRSARQAGQEALTQAIGRAAFRASFEGLLVPSAARQGGANLVVMASSLRRGSRLRVLEG